MNDAQTLKFENGKFLLKEVADPKLRQKLAKNAHWQNIENDSYITDNLGAAAAFRKISDPLVEKIFKKSFQEHYVFTERPELLSRVIKLLDPHQYDGIMWILSRKRSYLAHAPGSGKTATTIIASCLSRGEGQILFIVPPSLTLNWQREIYRFSEWAGHYGKVAIVPSSKNQNKMDWTAEFIVCPDSMLTKKWVYSNLQKLKKKFIAVDEASRLKDPFSERSLAFYGGKNGTSVYAGIYRNSRHVVFLDGSPMPNRPIELWAPTFALHPEAIDCRGYDDFGYRYCGAKPNDRGQWEYLYSSNEAELKEKLQKDFMQVVTESELTHPERQRSIVVMNKDVRSAEQKAWERKNLTSGFEFSEKDDQGDLARFRRELGVRKIPWIARYVRDRVNEKNESILVFAWHRDVVMGLNDALKEFKPGIILGGISPQKRDDFISEFQSAKRKILILNIAAAGRGFNLQQADRVIFGEFSWTDELNKQAEKRASRRGNERDFVRCEYIVAPNSMDEMVLNSVFTKEKRVEKIIG